MKKFAKKKDKWADLPGEFREMLAGAPYEKVYEEIRNAALYAIALQEQKANDQDLAEKKFAHDEAGKVYKEGAKICRLKVAYGREILQNRGQDVPGDVTQKISKTA